MPSLGAVLLVVLSWSFCHGADAVPESVVPDYVRAEDKSYAWEKVDAGDGFTFPSTQTLLIKLTSQTWQGIPWWHWLGVVRPTNLRHPGHVLLVVSGGKNSKKIPRMPPEMLLLSGIAQRLGMTVAVLGQVPNQPLLGGRSEDTLIAHTFQKFLETGDRSWPCLLPMVKSVVRAMDCVQELARNEFDHRVEKFVVTGGSKRGWTTWLSGAMDSRVCAIAPIVIDTLNIKDQMSHQLESWGGYSNKIEDYTRLDLPNRLQEPDSQKLLSLVDPYLFRDRLTMPKLIIIGTNDRYWPVDAVNLYFADLRGEKHIHYVPNAGHGLGRGAIGAVSTIQALCAAAVEGKALPASTWKFQEEKARVNLRMRPGGRPKAVRLWKASSDKRDFRDVRWSSTLVEKGSENDGGAPVFEAPVERPARGFVAVYGEFTYDSGSLESRAAEGEDTPESYEYKLSTNVRVFGPLRASAGQ